MTFNLNVQQHKLHTLDPAVPLWTLTIKEWGAEETSRQYPSIRSAMFSAVVSNAVVTVRGYSHTQTHTRARTQIHTHTNTHRGISVSVGQRVASPRHNKSFIIENIFFQCTYVYTLFYTRKNLRRYLCTDTHMLFLIHASWEHIHTHFRPTHSAWHSSVNGINRLHPPMSFHVFLSSYSFLQFQCLTSRSYLFFFIKFWIWYKQTVVEIWVNKNIKYSFGWEYGHTFMWFNNFIHLWLMPNITWDINPNIISPLQAITNLQWKSWWYSMQGLFACVFTSGAPATLSCSMPFLSFSSKAEYWMDWTWLKLAKCVGCRDKDRNTDILIITCNILHVLVQYIQLSGNYLFWL